MIVSCAPNPNHCGGKGGCSGSTGELAYDYVSKHGIVSEWVDGYTSYGGETGSCTAAAANKSNRNDNDIDNDNDSSSRIGDTAKISYLEDRALASVDGFFSLPTNSYDALVSAVAIEGPVVVTVAANEWIHYGGGVFDDSNATNHYDMNHAVVVEG